MSEDAEPQAELPILASPADGVPGVVADAAAMAACVGALKAGSGPLAVDAERAQGYRYGAEAYLIQLRRAGAGTWLIDPRAFAAADGSVVLADLQAVVGELPWILHAASQDLACLTDAGLRPSSLFDTELAARLLHRERVGLGPVIEAEFGVRLLKEHSAADWSRRPLPEDWLVYAALDVELLIPLAERLQAELVAAGKAEWADEEFRALIAGIDTAKPEREDPWRRLHGLSAVRTQAGLALARELWLARDELARRLDKGPSRIVPDQALTELAALVDQKQRRWPTREQLRSIDGFKRRTARRFEANWLAAIDAAAAQPSSAWPPRRIHHDGPPKQPRNWEAHHPEAFARWQAVRPVVNERAEELDLPAENLLSPAPLRALAWAPRGTSVDDVRRQLLAEGARPWQADAVSDVIAAALADVE